MMTMMNSNHPLRWHLGIEMEFAPTVTIQSPLRSIPMIAPRCHHLHLHHPHLMKRMSIINPVRIRSVDRQVHQPLWSPRAVHTSDQEQLQVFSSLLSTYSSGTSLLLTVQLSILCVSIPPSLSLSLSGVLNAETNQRIIHPRSLVRLLSMSSRRQKTPFEHPTKQKKTMTYLLSSCASDSLFLSPSFSLSCTYKLILAEKTNPGSPRRVLSMESLACSEAEKWIISHHSDT